MQEYIGTKSRYITASPVEEGVSRPHIMRSLLFQSFMSTDLTQGNECFCERLYNLDTFLQIFRRNYPALSVTGGLMIVISVFLFLLFRPDTVYNLHL